MRPQNEAELASVIRGAEGPLVILGGGTRVIAPCEGQVIETGGFSGVDLYEPGSLTIVAKAGTPLAEIESTLAAEGQRLPFEAPDLRGLLGRSGTSTIGGVVAANASGPRRVQAGACRDSLIGVRFVTGEGEIIKNGGRVMKNVTGYDLVKLLAGSWGTLGVLTEVSFKVLPTPEACVTLAAPGLSDQKAVAAMSAALGSPYEVNAAAHLPGTGTFLRIEGFRASVDYRAAQLRHHLAEFGAWDVDDQGSRWRDIRDVAAFHNVPGDVWRIAVKPSDAPEIVARAAADQALYDWGGGLVWLLMPEGTDLRARLGSYEGHATRYRGQGPGAFQQEPAAIAALTGGLRRKFDPRGILNRGLMEA